MAQSRDRHRRETQAVMEIKGMADVQPQSFSQFCKVETRWTKLTTFNIIQKPDQSEQFVCKSKLNTCLPGLEYKSNLIKWVI